MSTHVPMRPSWVCAGCSRPWPCLTRQQQLLAEYARTRASLAIYLISMFVAAAEDMPDAAVGPLHQRFLGWMGGPPPTPTTAPVAEHLDGTQRRGNSLGC